MQICRYKLENNTLNSVLDCVSNQTNTKKDMLKGIGVREGGAGGVGAAAPPNFWEFIYSGKNCLVIRATTVWWLDEYRPVDP
jgi:hypothetical protein